jgi:hypothetical protein
VACSTQSGSGEEPPGEEDNVPVESREACAVRFSTGALSHSWWVSHVETLAKRSVETTGKARSGGNRVSDHIELSRHLMPPCSHHPHPEAEGRRRGVAFTCSMAGMMTGDGEPVGMLVRPANAGCMLSMGGELPSMLKPTVLIFGVD